MTYEDGNKLEQYNIGKNPTDPKKAFYLDGKAMNAFRIFEVDLFRL